MLCQFAGTMDIQVVSETVYSRISQILRILPEFPGTGKYPFPGIWTKDFS